MIMRALCVGAVLSLGWAHAQDPVALEARLRSLEAKAARAATLERRVVELEGRLRDYEEVEDGEVLEEAVNALLQEGVIGQVAAPRSTGIQIRGQLRLRFEYRTVVAYGAPDPGATDEDFVVQRTRVSFDARVEDDVRMFVELQDSRLWGDELGTLGDLEGVDLHQGHVDFERIFGSGFTLRAGRFEMKLWNQRLISPLDWHPVGRAWDGFLLISSADEWDVVGGYQTLAEDPVIDSDQDDDFYWAAITYKGVEDHKLGAAFFWLHLDALGGDASFGTGTVHADGSFGALDYQVDAVIQFGDAAGADVQAYAFAVELGYTFEGDARPRISAEWTFASGDDDPTDGDMETFNPLFPFGHYYQGFLDLFAWKNGHDVAVRFQVRPADDWSLEVAVHGFWLHETADSWYGAAGTPIRTATGSGSVDDHVGVEVDVSAKVWMTENIVFWFGYSHFFPGDYVSDTGEDPDTDWVWLQLTANF